jgi:hypothetical protein
VGRPWSPGTARGRGGPGHGDIGSTRLARTSTGPRLRTNTTIIKTRPTAIPIVISEAQLAVFRQILQMMKEERMAQNAEYNLMQMQQRQPQQAAPPIAPAADVAGLAAASPIIKSPKSYFQKNGHTSTDFCPSYVRKPSQGHAWPEQKFVKGLAKEEHSSSHRSRSIQLCVLVNLRSNPAGLISSPPPPTVSRYVFSDLSSTRSTFAIRNRQIMRNKPSAQ